MTDDEVILLEIDPEVIKKESQLLTEAILSNKITIDYGKMILYEEEVIERVHVIRLDLMASCVAGLADPLGQLKSWIEDVFGGFVSWLWDKISSAIADLTAKIIEKIKDLIPEIADKIAYAIEKISGAISDSIVKVSTAINIGLTNIGAGLTNLSVGINNLGTSLAGSINMVGTALSTQILNVSTSISTSILQVSASVSSGITMVSSAIAQSALTISTAVSQSILSVSYSISQSINMVSTSLAGSITQISGAIASGFTQVSGAISGAIVQISGAISQGILMISGSILTVISSFAFTISSAITMIASSISNAILLIGTSLTTVLGESVATIISLVYLAMGKIEYATAIMTQYLPEFRTAMVETLKEVGSTIRESMNEMISQLRQSYVEVTTAIREQIQLFSQTVNQIMSETIQTIANNMTILTNTIANNMLTMTNAIAESGQRISNAITTVYRETSNAIRESYIELSGAIRESMSEFIEKTGESFERMYGTLTNSYIDLKNKILETSDELHKIILTQSDQITDKVISNFETSLRQVSDAMDEFSKRMMEIAKTFEGFVNSILQLPERLDPTMQKHARYMWENYWAFLKSETTEDVTLPYKKIPEFFKEASPSPWDGFKNLFAHVYKVINLYPVQPKEISLLMVAGVQAPPAVVVSPGKENWKWFTGEPILLAPLEHLWSSFVNYVSATYNDIIKPALVTIGEAIWNGIRQFIDWLINAVKGLVDWLAHTFTSFGQAFIDTLTKTAQSLMSGVISGASGLGSTPIAILDIDKYVKTLPLSGVASAVASDFTHKPLSFIEYFISIGKEFGHGNIDVILKELGISSPPQLTKEKIYKVYDNMMMYTFSALSIPLLAQIPVRAIAYAIYQTGSALFNSDLEGQLDLRPFGIGINLTVHWGKLIGGALTHFSKQLKEMVDVLAGGLVYGLAIWLSQPISKFLSFHARNVVPIELPALEEMLEFARRSLPHEAHKDIYDTMKFYTAIYGYSDFVIDLLYKHVEDYYIEITDRFEQPRKIPLSLMYQLPSASDVARMMVRDIILELDSFKKIFLSRGMSYDIAILYYLLHFRYPPPERLWNFVMRGISGLLWFKPSDTEKSLARSDAERVGAWLPKDIYELNFQGKILFDGFASYMKWHDYAKFSYLPDFTSDNQIMIDTLADIPTKIDQRWMVRFGLYELMSEKGITLRDPVSAFVTKLTEPQAGSKIMLDLTNFCRTLQATGLHPYYVPITAVAETINTIADERTLLRTGVLNLYKEGFIDSNAVIKMFKGLIMTSFKVAYYNLERHTWEERYINVPLRYLEMESRLMGLRAIMDRALDILRDIQKDALTGYQEYIIANYDEFKKKFSNVIENINSIYSAEFKNITGTDIPPELKLTFIEEYYKPYVESLSIWREVYTVRRIRMWTQRWLGWLMYRVGYGVVKPEEVKKLAEYMASACRLPEAEKTYITKVLEFMSELSIREYIPTPSQLATMAEYVKIPSDVIDKVFEQRGIRPEYAEIWKKYIEVRPLADDVRALVSTYIRALRYAPEAINYKDQVMGYMAKIGFTAEELNIFKLRIDLEELIIQSKEYVPTPSQLATLAEYTPVPDELINKAFEIRKIPPEWGEIWKQFIDARTIADDVRNLVTSYLRALRYNPAVKQFEGDVKAFIQRAGYGSDEVKIFELRAMIEELSYSARQYVPTPITLATVCELIPEARGYFDSMAKLLGMPSEWQGLWAKYIDLKPLADELKKLVTRAENLYKSFIIPEDTFKSILDSYGSLLGYTEKEVEFLLYLSQLERHATAWKEVIGDVDRLLTLSDYSPKAREYALGLLYKMIDSLNIDDETKKDLKEIWEQYIRIKPVKDEITKYITDLINAFVDGIITQQIFEDELQALKEWGLDDYEIQFYKAIATLRKARKLKITLY